MAKRLNSIIGLLILYATVTFLAVPILYPTLLKPLYNTTSYYILLGLFLSWLGSTAAIITKAPLQAVWEPLKKNWLIVLFPFLLCVLIFYSMPPYFRVLSDETNLLGVSKSMFSEHGINNITMGLWYDFGFHPMNAEIEKRPLLFPFFTYLVHLFRGYHAENAFIANFLILLGLLGMLAKIVSKFLGTVGTVAALILIVSQPVVSQTATSAGFDLLAVFFLIMSFMATQKFLKESDETSFLWLWLTLLMLCQTRHESALVFGIVILSLLGANKIKKVFFTGSRSWLYALTPLFLTPRLWQYQIRAAMPNTYETSNGVPGFSLAHWADHIRLFFTTFLRFDYFLPYATIVNWIGAISLVFFVIHFKEQSQNNKNSQLLFFISSLSFLLVTNILFAFHIGDLTHPVSSRYFVLLFILLSIFAVWGLQRLPFLGKNPILVLVLSIGFFILYQPVSIKNDFMNLLTITRMYRTELVFFKSLGHKDILIIDDRPGQFTVHDYGSVNFDYANKEAHTVLKDFKEHLYRDIYAIQEIKLSTNEISKDTHLDPVYKLETVLEEKSAPDSLFRISKVILDSHTVIPEAKKR